MKYLFSVLVDNIGSSLITFILPLFILDTTDSIINLSIISSFSVLPFLVLGLPFGALVDKLNIKKILYYSDFIRSVLYIFLVCITLITHNTIILISSVYFVTIVVSCINVINSISELTFISFFVSKEDFSKMNSQIYGIQYISGMIMPAIGGFFYNSIPVSWIFLFSSICFFISSITVFNMDIEFIFKKTKNKKIKLIIRNLLIDIKGGFIYLKTRREILVPLVVVSFFNILVINFQNDNLIMLKNFFKFSNSKIGIIYSVASLGALAGTFFAGRLSLKIRFNKLLFTNLFIQLCLRIIFVFVQNYILISIVMFAIDVCQSILNIIIITNRQNYVEKEYLGRVNSIYKTVLIGINSIGYIYGGAISSIVGSKNGILASAVGIAILLVVTSKFIFFEENKKLN